MSHKYDPKDFVGKQLCNGTYVIDDLHDEGGFGYVYRGHQISTGSKVAIKVLKRRSDSGTQNPLEEARRQLKARSETEAIVAVYEILPADSDHNDLGVDLFIMEWIDSIRNPHLGRCYSPTHFKGNGTEFEYCLEDCAWA